MTYTYPIIGGGTANTIVTYHTYSIRPSFAQQYNASAPLVDTVTLADGTFYHFDYETTICSPACPGAVTGRIAKITLPSLAWISYDYTDPTNISPYIIGTFGEFAFLTRKTALGSKTFTKGNTTQSVTQTITDAIGTTTDTFAPDSDNSQLFLMERSAPGSDTTFCYNMTYSDCAQYGQTDFTYPITSKVTIVQGGHNSPPRATEEDYDSLGQTVGVSEFSPDFYSGVMSLQRATETIYATLSNGAANKPASVEIVDGSGTRAAYTQYTYDGSSPAVTSGLPHHSSATGARGNLTKVSRWVGPTSTTDQPAHMLDTVVTYDDAGQVLTVSASGAPVTKFAYDVYDAFPVSVTRPSTTTAHVTTTAYDPYTGLLTSITDENNLATTTQYDSMLRPISVDYPDGGHTGNAYTANSVTTTTLLHDAVSASVTYNADASGHLANIQQAASGGNIQIDYQYNSRGQQSTVSNPYQPGLPSTTDGVTTYTYSPATGTTDVLKQDTVSHNTSSTQGAVQTTTDERGIQYLKSYDGLGRLITVQEPDGWTTNYFYDTLDNIIEIDQTGGSPDSSDWQIRRFQYDSLSRLVNQYTPEAGGKSFYYNDGDSPWALCSYDPSNVCGTQDEFANFTQITYDVLGRPTSVGTPEGETLTYAYDAISLLDGTPAANAIGRMVKMQRNDTMREMSYDTMGRVKRILDVLPSDVPTQVWHTITAKYNLAGQQTSLTYPDGRKVGYTYDTLGRLTDTTLLAAGGQLVNSPYVSGITYAPAGPMTSQTFGNGIQQTATYNSRLQQTGYKYLQTASSNTIADKTFVLTDPNGKNSGLIWGITDNVVPAASTTYTYDNENRLTSARTGTPTSNTYHQTYSYDAFGNQNQAGTFSLANPYNAHNQPVGIVHDPLGNLTPDTALAFSADSLIYQAGQDDTSTYYFYDAANMRASVQSGSHWRETLYLGNTLLAVRSDTSSGWTDIIYSGGQRVAIEPPSGPTQYHITDHLGSLAASTSATGAIQGMTEMTPYGRVVSDTSGSNLLFTGKERDLETGLDYFGGRYYSSTLNRFISPDPTGLASANLNNPQTLNLYAYANHNPLSFTDPTGFDVGCDPTTGLNPNDGSAGCYTLQVSVLSTSDSITVTTNDSEDLFVDSGVDNDMIAELDPGEAPLGSGTEITCDTQLPNGKTVGDYVRAARNRVAAVAGSFTPRVTGYPTYTAFKNEVGGGSQIDFKNTMKGQGTLEFLGSAGNFAYYAIGSTFFRPGVLNLAAGYYAATNVFIKNSPVHFSDLTLPYLQDDSAKAQQGPGLASNGCKGH